MAETAETVNAREWKLPDETAPIRLMATIWADTAGVHDDLGAGADVDAWLDAVGIERSGELAGADEWELALRLRDSIRRLAAEVTEDGRDTARSATTDVATAVRDLNDVVAHLPVPQIRVAEGGVLRETVSTNGSVVAAGLAGVAQESIALLGGPEAGKIRACYAPGCVLYFMKTHPRREWCSVACGNRVRAARHYEKVRSEG
jgi:predicted RNA-binding Zn ribbon-like protein